MQADQKRGFGRSPNGYGSTEYSDSAKTRCFSVDSDSAFSGLGVSNGLGLGRGLGLGVVH